MRTRGFPSPSANNWESIRWDARLPTRRVSHMQANMMPGDFVKNQIGRSSLRITSNYTDFEHRQKREMAERLL